MTVSNEDRLLMDEIVRLKGNLPPFLQGRYASFEASGVRQPTTTMVVAFWEDNWTLAIPHGQWERIPAEEEARMLYVDRSVGALLQPMPLDHQYDDLAKLGKRLIHALCELAADAPDDCIVERLPLYLTEDAYFAAWEQQAPLRDRAKRSQYWQEAVRVAKAMARREKHIMAT